MTYQTENLNVFFVVYVIYDIHANPFFPIYNDETLLYSAVNHFFLDGTESRAKTLDEAIRIFFSHAGCLQTPFYFVPATSLA